MMIPFFELVGDQEGPHGFITGGMHENEINGIATVRTARMVSARSWA
tara:strand:- start:2349 stop:2489 length:141 start_codon:yes stop_codon:yes gene_type:complete